MLPLLVHTCRCEMTEECNLRPSVSECLCVCSGPSPSGRPNGEKQPFTIPPSATSPCIAVNQPLIGMQARRGNTGSSPRSRCHNRGLHLYRNTSREGVISQCVGICRCRANNNKNNNEQHCNNSWESFCGQALLCQLGRIIENLFIICYDYPTIYKHDFHNVEQITGWSLTPAQVCMRRQVFLKEMQRSLLGFTINQVTACV